MLSSTPNAAASLILVQARALCFPHSILQIIVHSLRRKQPIIYEALFLPVCVAFLLSCQYDNTIHQLVPGLVAHVTTKSSYTRYILELNFMHITDYVD